MIATTNSSLSNLTIPSTRYFLNSLDFFFNHIFLLLLVIVGCIGNAFVIIIFGQRAFRTTIRYNRSNMSVYSVFVLYGHIRYNVFNYNILFVVIKLY